MPDPLGGQRGKVHPKLRMIANCSAQVNAIRAELSAAVAVEDKVAEECPLSEARSRRSAPKAWYGPSLLPG